MIGKGVWLDIRVRRLGLGAALVGAAMLLAPVGAIPEAAARSSSAKADLQAGPAAGDTGPTGRVQLKHRRGGDRVKLQLRDLAPKTRYVVREGVTRSVLASVRSNRLGKAKASILSGRLAGGGAVGLAGLPIEVCVLGSEEAVLEGQIPGDKGDGEDGCISWSDFTYREGSVQTDPEAAVQASLSLSSVSSLDLDAPLDSMSLFVGPGYLSEGMERPTADIPGPVTLWIADGDGTLQQVASIDANSCDGGDGTDDGDDSVLTGPDGGNAAPKGPARGRHHQNHGHHRHHGGAAMGHDGDPGDDANGDDGSGEADPPECYGPYYSWYADNSTAEGLPFGAAGVDELVGRSFEVRDGDGTVLLSGALPELQEVVFEDPFKDFTYEAGVVQTAYDDPVQASVSLTYWSDGTPEGTTESISVFVGDPWVWMMAAGGMGVDPAPIPGPVTFSIADADGNLQTVATIDSMDWFNGPPMLDGPGGMTVSFAFPDLGDGDWKLPDPPAFYAWYADNQSGDGLPLGVSSVKDLTGRSFEIRDGDGNLLFSGTLPELQKVDLSVDPFGGGTGTGVPGFDPSNGMMFDGAR